MFHKAHYTARSFGAIAVMSICMLGGLSAPAKAWNDDVRVCRDVVKRFEINDHVTYTERGTACHDDYGHWNLITPSRYSNYTGQVFFNDHGRMVFVGTLFPQARYYRDYSPNFGYADRPQWHDDHDRNDHHDHNDHNDRHNDHHDNDRYDQKRYKRH